MNADEFSSATLLCAATGLMSDSELAAYEWGIPRLDGISYTRWLLEIREAAAYELGRRIDAALAKEPR